MRAKTNKIAWRRNGRARQRGVAVVTALLLTTLAITIVASMFWQQHVQIRSIENQRLQLQKRWILRGALDWANLILRADAANSGPDHLGEPWAVPLVETRLDQFVENGRADADASDATISGSIVDAQSRYNLKNLAPNGTVDLREVAAFRRLLATLNLDPGLAQRTAELIAAAHVGPPAPDANASAGQGAPAARIRGVEWTDDLLAISGMTPQILDRLKDFIVILPDPTTVNANTAPLQVLAAKMEGVGPDEIARLIAGRERAYIRDNGDLSLRLRGRPEDSFVKDVSISSNYFLVNANVRLNKGSLKVQALLMRNFMTGSRLIWIREY